MNRAHTIYPNVFLMSWCVGLGALNVFKKKNNNNNKKPRNISFFYSFQRVRSFCKEEAS